MPHGRPTVRLDPRREALEPEVQAADAMETWKAEQVSQWFSSTEVIEQATLGRRQDESEIIKGQGDRDRHSGDAATTSRQLIEPGLKEVTQLAKAGQEGHRRSPGSASQRPADRFSQHRPADVVG